MSLTTEQNATLKAFVLADPTLGQLPQNNGSALQIATTLNENASPNYFVLKSTLGRHDLTDRQYVADDGIALTTFVWGGSSGGYINRSQGERDAFREVFNGTDECLPSLANVRTAFDDIFSGAGAGAVANRAHFRAAGRRQARLSEKILAVQTVGGPSQTGNRGTRTNPDTLTAEGDLTYQDVNGLMGWEF